jgi:glycerophosphoryl diester phosphodiesterase
MKARILFLLTILFNSYQSKTKEEVKTYPKKVVVAHRGASGYLPEHTMEAKAMAYAMNPDYIEQDLVLSKDDVPVVIHDIYLGDVTDVAEKFPERKREDGKFYVIDFTFEEIQTLNVTERFDTKTGKQVYPNRFPKGKGSFRLHSLQQEIELIQGLNQSTGNNIGIYPEIKNPAFHHENGKDFSTIVLEILSEYGYSTKSDNCILQCFDSKELERIRKELKSELFLVQLIGSDEATKELDHFATYADGIGPWYRQLLSEKVDRKFTFTSLVEDAHKLNLQVHPYTFRADALSEFDSFREMVNVILYQANADGGFTDFPDQMKSFIRE